MLSAKPVKIISSNASACAEALPSELGGSLSCHVARSVRWQKGGDGCVVYVLYHFSREWFHVVIYVPNVSAPLVGLLMIRIHRWKPSRTISMRRYRRMCACQFSRIRSRSVLSRLTK